LYCAQSLQENPAESEVAIAAIAIVQLARRPCTYVKCIKIQTQVSEKSSRQTEAEIDRQR